MLKLEVVVCQCKAQSTDEEGKSKHGDRHDAMYSSCLREVIIDLPCGLYTKFCNLKEFVDRF